MGLGFLVSVDDYVRRVRPAVESLNRFRSELVADLDLEDGGFGFWSHSLDWKTRVLLSDYLIQIVAGTAESLTSASLAAVEHAEQTHAETHAIKQAWIRLNRRTPRPSPEEYFAAIPRGGVAERREQRVISSAEQCFFHLGQTLDRFAAALIIVGGFGHRKVVQADWTSIEKLRATASKPLHRPRGRLEEPKVLEADTDGGRLQRQLLDAADPEPFGPQGWLSWMRETRNAMTHRPPAKKMMIMVDSGTFARVFYRHPRWSEVQSLVYAARGNSDRSRTHHIDFRHQFLMEASTDVLNGLCDSTTNMVVHLVTVMAECWRQRRAHPQLIIQHAAQWPASTPDVTESARFSGYGAPLRTPALDTITMNPEDSYRWQVARVSDDRWTEWHE
uniref:Uncharacterized protein n=1 Tax=Rhodococcus sp. NS1 TaxID=402236 RepID=A0A097SPL7_9NOCA|nr:hypothetical protein LRS1606.44 [Rhodococcus sp. NS1]